VREESGRALGWIGKTALARSADSTKGYGSFAERVGAGVTVMAPKASLIKRVLVSECCGRVHSKKATVIARSCSRTNRHNSTEGVRGDLLGDYDPAVFKCDVPKLPIEYAQGFRDLRISFSRNTIFNYERI